MRMQNTKLLGQMLIEKGVISEDQLRIAMLEQAKHPMRIAN